MNSLPLRCVANTLRFCGTGGVHTRGGPWDAVMEAWASGVQAMKEGWQYMTAPANRDVAYLGTIKASGAMCWGITDLLNVKYGSLACI